MGINLKEIALKNKEFPICSKVYESNKEIIDKVIDKIYLFENDLSTTEMEKISKVFFPLSIDLWWSFTNDLLQISIKENRKLEVVIAEEIVNYFK